MSFSFPSSISYCTISSKTLASPYLNKKSEAINCTYICNSSITTLTFISVFIKDDDLCVLVQHVHTSGISAWWEDNHWSGHIQLWPHHAGDDSRTTKNILQEIEPLWSTHHQSSELLLLFPLLNRQIGSTVTISGGGHF
jgi:hypothetical protein